MAEEEPFFDDRPLHNATTQEAGDCMHFIEKLRILRKLGGFGSIEAVMQDGKLLAFHIHQQENVV